MEVETILLLAQRINDVRSRAGYRAVAVTYCECIGKKLSLHGAKIAWDVEYYSGETTEETIDSLGVDKVLDTLSKEHWPAFN